MQKALRLHVILLMIEKLQRIPNDKTSNVILPRNITKHSEKRKKIFKKDEFTFSKDVKKSLQNMEAIVRCSFAIFQMAN